MVRPDGEATAYEYDREGRVCAFTRDGVGRVSVERDLLGRAVCAVGDGVHIAWQWENGFLVRQITHRSGRRSVVDFARDADGRIVSRTMETVRARLGADILVVPDDAGSEFDAQTALIQAEPGYFYMGADVLGRVAATPGVERASAQLFLASTRENCCSAQLQIIAFVFFM